jgi:predicted Zn-dependent protease
LIGSGIDLLLLSQGVPSPGVFTLGGLTRYSQPFETEADYVSLYLLARADYPLSGSADFWRRMSHSRPDHIHSKAGQSHPGSADRYLIMQATIAEIEHKLSLQQPLIPNPK